MLSLKFWTIYVVLFNVLLEEEHIDGKNIYDKLLEL